MWYIQKDDTAVAAQTEVALITPEEGVNIVFAHCQKLMRNLCYDLYLFKKRVNSTNCECQLVTITDNCLKFSLRYQVTFLFFITARTLQLA